MHREGHVGVVLALYAPLGLVVAVAGFRSLAVSGAVLAGALAMLPDIDMKIPLVKHRGFTHTVWFALLVGGVIGGLGAYYTLETGTSWTVRAGTVELPPGFIGALGVGAFGFVTAAVSIIGHVLADGLTPMGVQPYAPYSNESYTLDLATASNPIANYLLLGLGLTLAGGALYLGVPAAA